MEQEIFTSYVGMTLDEMKNLVIKQKDQLENKINGNITEQEKENAGFLFWNCKMLLRNIYMTCDKMINNYQSELTDTEIRNYSEVSKIIKNDQEKWTDIDKIKETFVKLSSINYNSNPSNNNNSQDFVFQISDGNLAPLFKNRFKKISIKNNVMNIKWNDKELENNDLSIIEEIKSVINNNSIKLFDFSNRQQDINGEFPISQSIKGTFNDECHGIINGKNFSVCNRFKNDELNNFYRQFKKEIMDIVENKVITESQKDNKQEQFYDKICEILNVDRNYILNNNKRLADMSATYYWTSERGGISLIVSDDGAYLGATSSVSLDKHLEEFKKGTNNKNFNENKILKLKCRTCNQEMSIDCSKLPKNVKTLDTMCPNCKTFIKYGNLNYEEQRDNKQEQFYDKICEILNVDRNYILNNNKRLADMSATYYWTSERGGISLIVSDDGAYLGATSSVSLDKHLEEFKKGTNNKNFNENKILKLNCRSCNQEIYIDCSKLPKNVKTLDTKCPNCETFIKYGNLNYEEPKTVETYKTKDENNTFIIKLMNNYNFSINFPYQLDELKVIDNTSVIINNKITIKYLSCPNKNDFEKRAIEIFEKSAADTNQKIDKTLNKYKINNIDVIEKAIIKGEIIQSFKFIYFNEAILTFAYNKNSEISKIVDEAIKTIKAIGTQQQERIERDPFKPVMKQDEI